MEIRMYRSAKHPDFQMEIRLRTEDRGLDLRCIEAVTALIEHYGYPIDKAIAVVQSAVKPELLTTTPPA